MARFPVIADQVPLSAGAPVATDNFVGAILRDAGNTLVRASLTGGVQYANGLLLTALGQVVYNDATAGLPANTQFVNGLPLAPDGSMCIALAPAATYSNGLPFAANGALSAVVVA